MGHRRVGKSGDPAGMPPCLPAGRRKSYQADVSYFLWARVRFTLLAQSSQCQGASLVQEQAEVAAIRFSPTFLPDLNKSTGEWGRQFSVFFLTKDPYYDTPHFAFSEPIL